MELGLSQVPATPPPLPHPAIATVQQQQQHQQQQHQQQIVTAAPPRRCYRHSNAEYIEDITREAALLDAELASLPSPERDAVSTVWALFGAARAEQRMVMLRGILNQSCVPQLAYLQRAVPPLVRLDPLVVLPTELSFVILSYLDARSLCRVAQVSSHWAAFANDDFVWHRMCEQHIDKQCTTCGWGLPLLDQSGRRKWLERQRRGCTGRTSSSAIAAATTLAALKRKHDGDNAPTNAAGSTAAINLATGKKTNAVDILLGTLRRTGGGTGTASSSFSIYGAHVDATGQPIQALAASCLTTVSPTRARSSNSLTSGSESEDESQPSVKRSRLNDNSAQEKQPLQTGMASMAITTTVQPLTEEPAPRPWKDIYAERYSIERNWRRGRHTLTTIAAHREGVLCLQFDDRILVTGGFDGLAKVWDVETGRQLRTLSGHRGPVRTLYFDECKLVTGSDDSTVRVWNYRTGTCINTLRTHNQSDVTTLHCDGDVLAAGCGDGSLCVWNVTQRTNFTINNAHDGWINQVRLWEGTQLFSCGDDGTARLWDLTTRKPIRTFRGHSAAVQTLLPSRENPFTQLQLGVGVTIPSRPLAPNNAAAANNTAAAAAAVGQPVNGANPTQPSTQTVSSTSTTAASLAAASSANVPILVTGGLDLTMRIWNIATGECIAILAGHSEGVWALAFDNLRATTASADGSVMIWDVPRGRPLHRLEGHVGSVTDVSLSDTRVVSGGEDGNVCIWDFGVINNNPTNNGVTVQH
ncbi:WD40 repeat-like protein [Ramicandelaber brevisporus]|nr:WD40 repeat-like protein [Ramicandelaber brevisporus]